MGTEYKEVGGTPTAGLPKEYTNYLRTLLGGPGAVERGNYKNTWERFKAMGADNGPVPGANTGLIAQAIQRLLSGDLNDPLNSSINKAIQTQRSDDVDELRARYNLAGLSYSSPAAYGESEYLARSAPNLLNALGGQQIQALSMLLPQFGALTQQGTPQAQVVAEPGFAQQALGTITGLAGAASPFFAPFGLFGNNPFTSMARIPNLNIPNYSVAGGM